MTFKMRKKGAGQLCYRLDGIWLRKVLALINIEPLLEST